MKALRIALERVRLLAALLFAAAAACMLVPGTCAAFSATSLAGGYGCLGRTTSGVSTDGVIFGSSELMRLSFDGVGGVKGTIVLNSAGEVCSIAASGTYSVNFGGLGTMNLIWTTATGDPDRDLSCSSLVNGKGAAQHTTLVVEHAGSEFDFQSADDFLTTPGSGDSGDLANPLVGSCKKQ
jgi:hypothetical protein